MFMTLAMCLSLLPVSVFAVDYNADTTYTATMAGDAQGSSSNGFTKAIKVWKDAEYYYLAVASRDNKNEVDDSFREAASQAVTDQKFVQVDYITGNHKLVVKDTADTELYSSTPAAATGKGSNIWVIVWMTAEKFNSYENDSGGYDIPVLNAGGFALKNIIIDPSIKQEIKKDVSYSLLYDLNGGTAADNLDQYIENNTGSATFTVTNTIPTKTGYTFDGWYRDENFGGEKVPAGAQITITENDASKSVTLHAKWKINEYTVTWVNYDDTELEKDENVEYGATPSYDGETPTKASTAQYSYTFAGWNPEISTVTGNVTYKATYTETVNKYTVTFVDENGTTVLKEATEYAYGTAAADIEKPADPTKAMDATYFYTFAGWTPAIEDVTADAVYTATYTPTAINSAFDIAKEVTQVGSTTVSYSQDAGEATTIPTAKVGDTITWKITLYNQGNIAQTFSLSDTLTNGVSANVTIVDEDNQAVGETVTLAAGTSAVYTATYVVGVNDAGKDLTNVVVAKNQKNEEDKGESKPVPVDPALIIDKTVNKTTVTVGNTLTYTIKVTNNTSVELKGVIVKDAMIGIDQTIETLAAGATETITKTYTVTKQNIGTLKNTASATVPNGPTYEDSVDTTVKKKPSKPSTDIPDAPPALNNTDHFAYIIGYPDGTVKPAGNITRAEVATIFFRLLTDEARDLFWATENEYSDVAANQWFNNAISTLSNAGIINGYEDGTFRPNAPITRAEFAKIAASFFSYAEAEYQGLFSDVPATKWYALYVEAASDLGLVTGYPDGTFLPEKNISRAEACTIVNRTIDRHPHEDQLHEDMIVWVDNPAPGEAGHEWYYEQVQEATNSHDYEMVNEYENWIEILENRDWAALEQAWSDSNSAPGGEVMK